MALRAAGRLSDRIRMRPVLGAGMSVRLMHGGGFVEYSRRVDWNRLKELVEGIGRKRRRMFLFDVGGKVQSSSEAGLSRLIEPSRFKPNQASSLPL
jgi:hypothetical protein